MQITALHESMTGEHNKSCKLLTPSTSKSWNLLFSWKRLRLLAPQKPSQNCELRLDVLSKKCSLFIRVLSNLFSNLVPWVSYLVVTSLLSQQELVWNLVTITKSSNQRTRQEDAISIVRIGNQYPLGEQLSESVKAYRYIKHIKPTPIPTFQPAMHWYRWWLGWQERKDLFPSTTPEHHSLRLV